MKDYLVKFEQLYTKIKDHQMILPDGVLAYRVLNSANLTTDQMTLCRATMTDLEYSEMVKQLRRLFADSIMSGHVNNPSTIQPKEEPVFFQEQNDETSSVYPLPWVPEEEEVGIEEMGIEKEIKDQEKEGETIRKVLWTPRIQKET